MSRYILHLTGTIHDYVVTPQISSTAQYKPYFQNVMTDTGPNCPRNFSLGDSGVRLAARLSYAVILGPIFAWYLLARSVLMIVKGVDRTPRKVLIQTVKA